MKPYKNISSSKKVQVRNMFNSISKEYDFLNKIMTFGNDAVWRKRIYSIAKESSPKTILDIATGTADIALELSNIKNVKIIGIDISEKMLKIGDKKILKRNLSSRIQLQKGDAENINYPENYFDIVTIGFGVRNFENLSIGLKETYRVLKKTGKLIILETSVPNNTIIKLFYKILSRTFIPTVGYLLSNDRIAYSYLQESAEKFPCGKKFLSILEQAGFKNARLQVLMLGATSIYIAEK